MVRQGLSLLAILSLTACGSSSSNTTTAAVPTVTPPTTTTPVVVPPVVPPVVPTPTIGATMSQAQTFTQAGPGQPFVIAAGTTPITLVQTNTARTFKATYDLTVNGVTYNLRPSPTNTLTGSMNSHVATVGGEQVSLFLNDDVAYGKIANTQITDASGTTQFFGVIGPLTDPANLPATASYAGIGEISVDKAGGAFDDAPASTVTLDADFTAGTLTGQFNVMDPAGDNGGNFDIAGSTTLDLTGTISGSQFTADVDYTNLLAITQGLNAITPEPVTGGFFGTAGFSAVGSGLSVGSSTGTNDAIVYTRIQATKQ